ncbi:hypothetical protein U8335_03990 [Roseiconus lacunae]|uniref:hypothetical protein n=1 Tax=Roseiconus lacunae TaxID=2605694 RepID=UPI00308C2238|nr:hypothetical protein U8335_03990 [Stieleria sp. HD01]
MDYDDDNEHDDDNDLPIGAGRGDTFRDRRRISLSETRARLRNPHGGVSCPDCGSTWCPVIRTVRKTDNKTVRARQCQHCDRRFTTTERVTG